MSNKVAIHDRSGSFSDQWIKYCHDKEIPFKRVNCYSNNIIDELKDCKALMWHFSHIHPKDILFAKELMFALEQIGMMTFPDFNTMWHFDDKVGQKYLLEAIEVPFVNTYVFYDMEKAQKWVEEAVFPKVFKLRSGSGSNNVRFVKNQDEAYKLIKKAFGEGFKQRNRFSDIKERTRKFRNGIGDLKLLFGGLFRFFKPHHYEKVKGRESGYIYFQDFIPNNKFDIRVVVIDKKAFAIKRMVRKGDFRASGSGEIYYAKENFREKEIKLAIEIADKLKIQSLAIDYVFDEGEAKVVEINYGFNQAGYRKCVGYWDEELSFHKGSFNPYGWMVDSVLSQIS